ARVRYRGDGQDERRGLLRGRGVPAWRAKPVLRLRGVAGADHPEYALDRPRPRALGPERPPRLPATPPRDARPGDASRPDPPALRGAPAHGRGLRPRHEPDERGHEVVGRRNAAALGRLPQDLEGHRDVHEPDPWR